MNTNLLPLSNTKNKPTFIKKLFTVFLIAVVGTQMHAQLVANNYTFAETTGNTYTPITGGTVIATGAYNTTSYNSLITPGAGFNFIFNNTSYSSLYLSDNGYVAFGLAPAGSATSISNTAGYSGVIAAFSAQLVGAVATSEIRWELVGSSPNRVLVIQFKDLQRRSGITNLNGLMNFQIQCYETTGVIETIYQSFTTSSGAVVKGEVGLRGASNADFYNRKDVGTAWVPSTAGTIATDGLTTSNTVGPAAGTKFTWTPCFAPSTLLASLQGDNSTVDISWTAPLVAPPGGYDYEVRTSGNPGSGATGLFASGNTASTSVSVPGLSVGFSYYIYVKANCRTAWVPSSTAPSSVFVTPACAIASIPYTQNFESVVTPAIPNCNSTQVVTGAAFVTRDNTSTPYYGFTSKNLATNGAVAMDTWYFTQGINFPAPGSYKVKYTYGGSRELPQFVQKMDVAVGSTASVAGMAAGQTLAQHTNIKNSPITNTINFTVTSAGTYYIGFRGYAAATQGVLQLDDINVDVTTCFPPTALSAGQVTAQSAIINWTPPASTPASGYEYYILTPVTAGGFTVGTKYQILTVGTTNFTAIGAASNTVGTTFIATGVGSGTGTAVAVPSQTVLPSGFAPGGPIASLTGLTPSTTYYFWVRSSCGGSDVSEWSAIGSFTTLAAIVYCSPADNGTRDPNGITNVLVGSINNTTGLESATAGYGNYSNLTTNVAQGTTIPVAITYGTGFTYFTNIWIDWNDDGDFGDSQELVYTGVSGNANPTTLNASFVVPTTVTNGATTTNTLGPHRMRIGGIDDPSFTGGALTECRSGAYQAYEDYTVYVITPPPALTLSGSSNLVCAGESTGFVTVTSTHSDYQVYSWSPAGGVGGSLATGYFFSPTTTTTYTLTATQTSGSYASNTATYSITVNPLPTPITLAPTSITRCQSDVPTLITASGGVVSGISIMSENFNSGTGGFTTVNNSTSGTPANAAWTIRSTGYNPGGSSGIASVVSNDNSSFYISNSDAQGSGSSTDVTLLSPTFSLAGYTSASLSFFHYYKVWVNGYAAVDIFVPGTGWVNLQTWGDSSNTSSQGTATNFAHPVFDLTPYVGLTGLQIRFHYVANWGYVWAIDNVSVSGSAVSAITWSPSAGLYTDAAGLVPYSGSGTSTIYAKPSVATVTYEAYAETPDGCYTTSYITVNSTLIAGGTLSPATQSLCSGAAANLTLTGHTAGSIDHWEWATTSTFTVPNTIASTSATLVVGTITSTRYYRAVIVVGGCTTYSTTATITIPSATWNGTAWSPAAPDSSTRAIFAGNFTTAGTINACSVEVISGNVTFNTGGNLVVQNEVVRTGGTLTFENGASLVQVNSTYPNSGYITYKRNTTGMRLYDYTYWSSPLSPQTFVGLSPLTLWDKYWQYDTASNQYQVVPGNSLMNPGKGYIIRAPQGYTSTPQVFNGIFNGGSNDGVPNNGDVPFNILVSGANVMNLVGNPYPSALDANDFLTDPTNVSKIDGTLYFWTHNTAMTANQYTSNDYAVYNLVGSIGAAAPNSGVNNNAPTRYIAAGQGFFAKGIGSGGTVYFRNSMREQGSNTNFFRMSTQPSSDELEKHRIWLDLTNPEGAYKQTMVGYIESATDAKDRGFDSDMVDAGSAVNLYSLLESEKLCIQGRALSFDVNDQFPLGFRINFAGNYEIKLADFDGLFENQNIYLEDTFLGTIHDLKSGNYSFSSETGTFDTRFILRFTDSALGIDQNVFDENSVVVYKNEAGIHINSSNVLMKNVQIFDIRGRLLAQKKDINQNEVLLTDVSNSEQVLLVKVFSVDGAVVTKKIVN
jgi:hypothetical protein